MQKVVSSPRLCPVGLSLGLPVTSVVQLEVIVLRSEYRVRSLGYGSLHSAALLVPSASMQIGCATAAPSAEAVCPWLHHGGPSGLLR